MEGLKLVPWKIWSFSFVEAVGDWYWAWQVNRLVCFWRGSWRAPCGVKWGQGPSRVCSQRERRIRRMDGWRISQRSRIPLVPWWRTATCCTTSWARPASSLNRGFLRHLYVHKVCTLCPHTNSPTTTPRLFPLISIHLLPHIVADPRCVIPPHRLPLVQVGRSNLLAPLMLKEVNHSVPWKYWLAL